MKALIAAFPSLNLLVQDLDWKHVTDGKNYAACIALIESVIEMRAEIGVSGSKMWEAVLKWCRLLMELRLNASPEAGKKASENKIDILFQLLPLLEN